MTGVGGLSSRVALLIQGPFNKYNSFDILFLSVGFSKEDITLC